MLKSFLRSTNASVLPIIGVCLFALLAASGAALDYLVISNARSASQNVADSMVLAAANALAGGSSPDEAKQIGDDFYQTNRAQILGKAETIGEVRISQSNNTYSVEGEVSGATATGIMGIFGYPKLDFSTTATSQVNLQGVEIAFVVDVSNSMQHDGKIEAAKDGLEEFIDVLFPEARSNPNRRVSIIPYSDTVNFGGNYQSWLREDVIDSANPGQFIKPSRADYTGCFQHEPDGQIRSGATGSVRPGRYIPYISKVYNNAPTCPPSVSEVSFFESNPENLKNTVRKLQLGFGTSTDIGAVWGWRVLSPSWRGNFKGPEAGSYPKSFSNENLKYMIIMTDGNAVRTDPIGDGSRFDDREEGVATALDNFNGVCSNIKSEDEIHVFTISYNFNDTKPDLKNCAAGIGQHFNATTQDIGNVLTDIAKAINKIRLTS